MTCQNCDGELHIDYFKDKQDGKEKIHLVCNNPECIGYEETMDLHQSPIWDREI
jgi:hypothetical protein